jgi:hypothetical protein
MNRRVSGPCTILVVVAIAGVLGGTGVAQAQRKSGDKAYAPPKTAEGQPDLQGIWSYATITPLERPSELGGKQVFTDEEAAEFERETLKERDKDRRDGADKPAGPQSDVERAYNQFWWDYGTKVVGTKQTALVIDPADGHIPPLTAEGQKRVEARRGFVATSARSEGGLGRSFDSFEDRPLQERCLSWTTAGPPMLPGAYNNNVQLVQAKDYVVIVNEMIHEHRVVPLDGRAHVPASMQQWLGDSRGHWEGNTLVVDTTNFTGKTSFRGASDKLHLTERFTRVAPDALVYEFTVDDPATFTKTWKAAITMGKSAEQMYEYACHEGNYSIATVLAGAREQEKRAASAAKKGSN